MAKFEKISKIGAADDGSPDYQFYCPGCKSYHGVWVNKRNYLHAVWSFNFNLDNPTVMPSLNITSAGLHDGVVKEERCHSFITEGRIQYLEDCTHEMKGLTIELPELL